MEKNLKEVNIVALKTQHHEVHLGELTFNSVTVFKETRLDECQIWDCIKIIICDTTSVNNKLVINTIY